MVKIYTFTIDVYMVKILYSYLMGVDAIDQTICPEVLGMTKCCRKTDEKDLFVELDNNKQVEYRVKSPKFWVPIKCETK
jgi:hypothetical protein